MFKKDLKAKVKILKNTTLFKVSLIAVVCFNCSGSSLYATLYTWTNGIANEIWDQAGNWTPNIGVGYPSTSSDTAHFDSTVVGPVVFVNGTTLSVNQLTVDNSAGQLNLTLSQELEFDGIPTPALTANAFVTVIGNNGQISANVDSSLLGSGQIFSDVCPFNATSVTPLKTWTQNGPVLLSKLFSGHPILGSGPSEAINYTLTSGALVLQAGYSAICRPGDTYTINGGFVAIHQDSSYGQSGTIVVNGGTVTNYGNFAANDLSLGNATINIQGSSIFANGGKIGSSGAILTISGSAQIVNFGSAFVANSGKILGGTTVINGTSTIINESGGATINLHSTTITGTPTITNNNGSSITFGTTTIGSSGAPTITNNKGGTISGGPITISGGTLLNDGSVTAGTFTLSGGTVNGGGRLAASIILEEP